MKLQQLRYLCEVAKSGLNVSQAAESLHTSQPGVSKQIRLLEEELGVDVFVRNGKRVVGITEPGRRILAIAERVLLEANNLKEAGREFTDDSGGNLTIATTHTQARYVLPPVITRFVADWPGINLVLHQGNPVQVAEQVVGGNADLAIATEGVGLYPDLILLPCYQWNRSLVVPPGHPLLEVHHPSLESLAQFPLITYDYAFTGRSKMNDAFESRGLRPRVAITALDSDVIKTYVGLGLGVGIVASMAYDPVADAPLVGIDASHLFESSTAHVGVRRGAYLRRSTYDFIELFAPSLDRRTVNRALAGGGMDYGL